nr:hypothetical protein [uncultured bacterium]
MSIDVPFADEAGIVSGSAQDLRESHRIWREGHVVEKHAMRQGVLTREQGRPRGRAHGQARNRVLEPDTLRGEPIEVRRLHVWVAGESEGLCPPLVRDHDQEVRPVSGRRRVTR